MSHKYLYSSNKICILASDSGKETKKQLSIALRTHVYDILKKQMNERASSTNTKNKTLSNYVNNLLEKFLVVYRILGEDGWNELYSIAQKVDEKQKHSIIARIFVVLLKEIQEWRIEELTRESITSLDTKFDIKLPGPIFKVLFETRSDSTLEYYAGCSQTSLSNYVFYFSSYLQYHKALLDNIKEKDSQDMHPHKRFFIASEASLIEDIRYHRRPIRELINWHGQRQQEGKKIELYYVQRDLADNIKQRLNNAPENFNIGLWKYSEDKESYAVQFFYRPTELKAYDVERTIGIRVSFPGLPRYEAALEFINELNKEIANKNPKIGDLISFFRKRDLELDKGEGPYTPQPPAFTRDLVQEWPEIVNVNKRLQTSIPFLSNVIEDYFESKIRSKERLRILDSAAQLGYEALKISERDYADITFNEPDKLLYDKAVQDMKRFGTVKDLIDREWKDDFDRKLMYPNTGLGQILLLNEPWNLLTYTHFDRQKFNLVICTGNEIAHQTNTDAALEDLCKLLVSGGMLIIDHRNFSKINRCIEVAKENNSNPYDEYIKNDDQIYRYKRKYMYCSENIIAGPKEPKDGRIPLVFKNIPYDTLVPNTELLMHPLHVNEFCKKLRNLGTERFEKIKVYGDYEIQPPLVSLGNKGDDGSMLADFDEQKHLGHDFFVYVAIKE